MKLKELNYIENTLDSLIEFASSNADSDESGIYQEMEEMYYQANIIISKAKYKIYLKNAKNKIKRNLKK